MTCQKFVIYVPLEALGQIQTHPHTLLPKDYFLNFFRASKQYLSTFLDTSSTSDWDHPGGVADMQQCDAEEFILPPYNAVQLRYQLNARLW